MVMSEGSRKNLLRLVCWLRGHNWVEIQVGESKLGLNSQAECTRCGKTISGTYKYRAGGPNYPDFNDE